GKELARVLRGIWIEPWLLAPLDLLEQGVVRGLKDRGPLGRAHAGMQRRQTVDGAVQQIQLVSELVRDHVVALALPARLDVLPREDYRARVPRLAAQYVVSDVHHAGLVDMLAPRHDE